jgi:4'-phosphopantetheinyl transferase
MIHVRHFDLSKLSDAVYLKCLNNYSGSILNDIARYRRMEDRKARLIAREIIKVYLKEIKCEVTLSDWQLDENKKPFFEKGPHFNISHSGNAVLVAFYQEKIGVDIETKELINYNELMHFFHPEEIQYIEGSENVNEAFYFVWTRKEAYLKAVGTGIINGLNDVNVLPNCIHENGEEWHLNTLEVFPNYAAAICTKNQDKIDTQAFILQSISQ